MTTVTFNNVIGLDGGVMLLECVDYDKATVIMTDVTIVNPSDAETYNYQALIDGVVEDATSEVIELLGYSSYFEKIRTGADT